VWAEHHLLNHFLAQSSLTVRSRSAHGSFTFRLRFAHGPLTVRSRSAHGPLTDIKQTHHRGWILAWSSNPRLNSPFSHFCRPKSSQGLCERDQINTKGNTVGENVIACCMLFIPCMLTIYHTTNTLNRTKFMTSINLLHISEAGCHPQGNIEIKGLQAQNAKLGIALS